MARQNGLLDLLQRERFEIIQFDLIQPGGAEARAALHLNGHGHAREGFEERALDRRRHAHAPILRERPGNDAQRLPELGRRGWGLQVRAADGFQQRVEGLESEDFGAVLVVLAQRGETGFGLGSEEEAVHVFGEGGDRVVVFEVSGLDEAVFRVFALDGELLIGVLEEEREGMDGPSGLEL